MDHFPSVRPVHGINKYKKENMKLGVYIKHYIELWKVKRFWRSKKGLALTHKVFDMYKNSPMFKERCKYFGSIESAKLFTFEEFNFFKRKALNDKEIAFTIFREPDKIINELLDKDTVLKKYVSISFKGV